MRGKGYFIRALALVKKKKKSAVKTPAPVGRSRGLIRLDGNTTRKLPGDQVERVEAQENGNERPPNLDLGPSTPQAAAGVSAPPQHAGGFEKAPHCPHLLADIWSLGPRGMLCFYKSKACPRSPISPLS